VRVAQDAGKGEGKGEVLGKKMEEVVREVILMEKVRVCGGRKEALEE
jgi:hypothetical protein